MTDAEREFVVQIVEWLEEAADDIDSWGAYAAGYFQQKWDLPADVKRVTDQAALVKRFLEGAS